MLITFAHVINKVLKGVGAFHRKLLFFFSTHGPSEASCQVLPLRKEKEIKFPF